MGRKKKNIEIHEEQLFNELLDLEDIYSSSVKKYAGSSYANNDWDYDSDSYGNYEW
jgi:hypothetical protein